MKPATAATTAVSALLAAAILCLGVRHAIDIRHEFGQQRQGRGATPDLVDSSAAPPARDRPSPPAADQASMTRRLSAAMSTTISRERSRALLDLTGHFTVADWPLAMQAMKELSMMTGGEEYTLLLSSWANADPAAAMAWTKGLSGPGTIAIRAWTLNDPDAAFAYARATSGFERDFLSRAVLPELARGDLPRLVEALHQIPARELSVYGDSAAHELARLDPEKLRNVLDSLEPAARKNLLPFISGAIPGAGDRAAFVSAYAEELGPQSYAGFYKDMVSTDPSGTLTELDKLDPGPVHEAAAIGAFIGLYESGNVFNAIVLANRFPGEITDYYVNDMITSVAPSHAADLLDLVTRMKDGRLNLSCYRLILGTWSAKDPSAAEAWLSTHEVPEQIRRELKSK